MDWIIPALMFMTIGLVIVFLAIQATSFLTRRHSNREAARTAFSETSAMTDEAAAERARSRPHER